MSRTLLFAVIAAAVMLSFAVAAFAQQETIVVPPSTIGLPGLQYHTNLYIARPNGIIPDTQNPPATAETPGSLACIYGLTPPTTGCPRSGSPVATGGAKAIAVVDFGHYPNLQSDFNHFNAQYGLPAQTLQFVPDCQNPPDNTNTGWDVEMALDVEYAHAMAPNAQIIVGEFCTGPFEAGQDAAEWLAGQAVLAHGGGEVSNSFGRGEFPAEAAWDQFMHITGVTYYSSSGDSGIAPQYPSVSPNTVSAGGTLVMRDSNGNFTGESCWSGSGGGISQFEPLPHYQLFIANRTGVHRGTPDWSGDAAPTSGAAVYASVNPECNGWCKVGGTSLTSPMLAGIVNNVGSFKDSTPLELAPTYQVYLHPVQYHTDFFDVTTGNNGMPAVAGWDQCTGLGSPRMPRAIF